MLLRFWKASLGPTQAGRRGCWHLYPPQPGLAGLGCLGWLVTMGDNFSAFQRRVQSLKAPLLRVGPFISGAQWPQIRHNILRDHSQRGHASPRGGGGGRGWLCEVVVFIVLWKPEAWVTATHNTTTLTLSCLSVYWCHNLVTTGAMGIWHVLNPYSRFHFRFLHSSFRKSKATLQL